MKKVNLYFNLFMVMLGLGLVEAVTGFVLWLAFPESGGGGGKGGGQLLTFLSVTKQTWIGIHDWVGIAIVAIVALHIVLHWKWIWRMSRQLITGLAGKTTGKAVTVSVSSEF